MSEAFKLFILIGVYIYSKEILGAISVTVLPLHFHCFDIFNDIKIISAINSLNRSTCTNQVKSRAVEHNYEPRTYFYVHFIYIKCASSHYKCKAYLI